jgi:hypothetical protein
VHAFASDTYTPLPKNRQTAKLLHEQNLKNNDTTDVIEPIRRILKRSLKEDMFNKPTKPQILKVEATLTSSRMLLTINTSSFIPEISHHP